MGMQVGVGEGRMVGKDPAEWSLKIEHGVEEEEVGGTYLWARRQPS